MEKKTEKEKWFFEPYCLPPEDHEYIRSIASYHGISRSKALHVLVSAARCENLANEELPEAS